MWLAPDPNFLEEPEFRLSGHRHGGAARTLGSDRARRFHQRMLAARPHRRAALRTHLRPTLSRSLVVSALAGAFREPADQNAAGATRVAKIRRAAPPKPGARRADDAPVPVSRGRGGIAPNQPAPARAVARHLCLAAVVGGTD